MRRVRAQTSGSCRWSQRSLGPTDCCVMPAPVRCEDASAPSSAAQLVDLGVGARVVVEQRRAAAAGRPRRARARTARSRRRRRRRSRPARSRPPRTPRDQLERVREPRARVLLRPAGLRRGRRVGQRVRREQPALRVEHDGLDRGRAQIEAEQHGRAQALRAASRKRRTRSRSTGFQVSPSRLRSLPTMTPSMKGAKAAMLAAGARVEHDGRAPGERLADLAHGVTRGSAPAIGPETRIASASDETAAERARTPSGRLPSGERTRASRS